jgi:hypothetical protein
MEPPEFHRLSGYILELSGTGFAAAALTNCDVVAARGALTSNWNRYSYKTSQPIAGEHILGAQGPYEYAIVCRWGRDRLLMVSTHRRIVEAFVSEFVRPKWPAASKRTPIHIQALVEAIAATGEPYRLTSVAARTAGFGDDLRSISYFGANVSQAQMFRDALPQLDCYQCGLRFANDGGGTEIARVGNDGFLSFALPFGNQAAKRLRDVEEVIRFLRKGGFLG